MRKRRLLTIFIIIFVDLLGFSLILPLLPFYAEKYSASPAVVGLLVASYAAMQMIGAPLLGRLSDKYGRRPILLISIFGTFVGFLLLGLAHPLGLALANLVGLGESLAAQNAAVLGVLFVSRMLDGLTGGNISVAQAYITDITDVKNRAKGMGLIGAAFGLGFTLGPALGGVLSRWGYAVPAFIAAAIAALNLLAVFIWLPESLSPELRGVNRHHHRELLSFQMLWVALSRPRVGPLLQTRFVYGLAFATFETIFALFAQYRLQLSAETTGYIMGYVGILVVLVQGVAIGRLTNRYSEIGLTFSGAVLMGLALLAWGFTPSVWLLMIVLIPLALAAGVLNTVLSSLLSKSVYPEEVGGTLGLSSSVESLTRVLAPIMGGILLGQVGTWAPGLAGALLMAWVVFYVWRRLITNPDPPLPTRPKEESAPVSS
ncbi:MAG: Tetracycline resistance protein, class C [Anaerolineae bacterium]|nr:Tetracycline resistance protein, class C [Anaerolineae bacterium]